MKRLCSSEKIIRNCQIIIIIIIIIIILILIVIIIIMTYPLGNRGRDSLKESRPRLPSGYVIIIIIYGNHRAHGKKAELIHTELTF